MQQVGPLPSTFPRCRQARAIARGKIVDLSARMDGGGKLAWDVPPGKWTILRIGHTTTGKDNHPAPEAGRGLECDKLSRAGIEAHFAGLMAKLVADNGPLVGQTLVTTHIDSWEVGSQNWTPRMREEFRRLRGYDLLPLLPVITGRVVDSVEVSERFLWDLRQTVSDLLVENYAGRMHALAKQHGLRLSIEAYGEPADDIRYAGPGRRADGRVLVVGQVRRRQQLHRDGLGRPRLWQAHPRRRSLHRHQRRKMAGVSRPTSRTWAIGPSAKGSTASSSTATRCSPGRRPPGHVHGPLGAALRADANLVGAVAGLAQYLARCQYLLRQGLFVADICYLQPEGSPRGFSPPGEPRRRRCGRATISTAARPKWCSRGCRVKDGRLVLPDGMSYRVLVLPRRRDHDAAAAGQGQELVDAGAR